MDVPVDLVKKLRERTGAGIADCRSALEICNLDLEKAMEEIKKKGLAHAEKKASSETKEGIVEAYIHHDSKLGVLIELSCETDFVAKTSEFRNLAKEIAMQIAIDDPLYISREDVQTDVIEKERNIYKEQLKDEKKPENVIDKIIDGKIENYYKSNCLLELPYMRDSKITVNDLIAQTIGQLRENIRVRRFARFKVGEE